jgi:uncharacterized protein
LLPPWKRYRVVERHGTIHDGDWVRLRIDVAGWPTDWVAEHTGFVANEQFVDRMVSGPVRRWVHTHRFGVDGPAGSVIEDTVDYDAPFGPLGRLVVGRHLPRMFDFRHRRTRNDLVRQAPFTGATPLRIAVTGASGLIGRELVPFLTTAGHEVIRLVRRPAAGPGEISWDPAGGRLDADRLEDVDAVVHLAGERIRPPWTRSRRGRIRRSRIDGTLLLSQTLARMRRLPRVLVSMSGINYYGDRGDAVVAEETPPGDDFLATLCVDWEGATAPAAAAGIRVVNLRNGIVLAGRGGALPVMALPFRLGVGGRLGDGRQFVSWISADDLVGVIYHAVHDDRLAGPVNAVAPNPVTNAELSRTLGRVLRRPTLFPVPAPAIRAALGEAGRELVLASVRAAPGSLAGAGFHFDFPTLEDTLRFQLGRT